MFVMPHVEIGDMVIWKPAPNDTKEVPALVTEVGKDAISCLVLPPGYHNGMAKSAVRYYTDPRHTQLMSEHGVWAPGSTHGLRDQITMLEDALAVAVKKVPKPDEPAKK